MLALGKSIVIRQEADGASLASLYPSLPDVDQSRLPVAGSEDMAPVTHLRFDPVVACNVRCVFCHSDFSGKANQLEPDELTNVFAFGMPALRSVAAGCAYEPTMSKHFEKYPEVLSDLRGTVRARVITNGLLLHRKDMSPWVSFGLEFLHVSVHSHKADIYADTMGNGARFEQVDANLKQFRRDFPEVPLHLINVVCRTNAIDVHGYRRWAFDEIGANEVMLARAFFSDRQSPGYPSASYVEKSVAR
jgi:wyosine [tRNA(Phe)-imidazoG37] synthetase (radical SAM superfamily)